MAEAARSRTGLAERVIALAADRGVTIAVAESLTGGALLDALVSVPGASRVLSGGVVAYNTYLKHSLLGVDATLLRDHGPVQGEVARQMAAGVRFACSLPGAAAGELEPASIGIATTGVAGPDPDPQSGQGAGTVWLGVSDSGGTEAALLSLTGDRAEIRDQTVIAALELVLGRLT